MLNTDEVDGLRTTSESVMVDTCVVTRTTGTTFDAGTGMNTPTTSTVYSGKCQFRLAGNTESSVLFGGEDVTVSRFVVAVPHDVDGIALEDEIVVTSTWDATAAGRTLRVTSIPSRSFNLSRAVGCEVVE